MSKLLKINPVKPTTIPFESIVIELSYKEAVFLRNLLGTHVSSNPINIGILSTIKSAGGLDEYNNEIGLKLHGLVEFFNF